MTDAMMSLRTLLEKSSDADLLREMVGFAAENGGGKVCHGSGGIVPQRAE
jgi:hypothetical protein